MKKRLIVLIVALLSLVGIILVLHLAFDGAPDAPIEPSDTSQTTTQPTPITSPTPAETYPTKTPPTPEPTTPTPMSELTLEDVSAHIVASQFVYERLVFPGKAISEFAGYYVDYDNNIAYFRFSPTSDFRRVFDVRETLLRYYTEDFVDSLLMHDDGTPLYIEQNGSLYMRREPAISPNYIFWELATHEILEIDGNRIVVESLVPGYNLADTPFVNTFRFIFIGDRISTIEFIDHELLG